MQAYNLMQPPPHDLDPPQRIHHLILIFAISDWFIKNNSMFLIYLPTIYQVKFNYSLFTVILKRVQYKCIRIFQSIFIHI